MNTTPAIDDPTAAGQDGVRANVFPRSAFREMEAALSNPMFFGIPLGATLNDCFVTGFIDGLGDWRRRTKWLRRVLYHRHRIAPKTHRTTGATFAPGRVLVTWSIPSHRYDRLLLPVLERLDEGECAVLYGHDGVARLVPAGVPHLSYREVMDFDARAWRREYDRCRPSWERTIRDACERHGFPEGAFELLSLELMVASQRVLGCLEFLEAHRPAAILTEYDRNNLWSCLVLAARKLGIPSLTLVHGVIERDAFGFAPVLADHILCWGELDRAKLVGAGEPPSRVAVAGCPRLSRDLPSPSLEGRRRLGIDHDGPVAILATSPERYRLALAEAFCAAIEQLPGMSGVVRLHPSEDLTSYAAIIAGHPTVSFVENSRASTDEALAATDVVVVRASGFGSDALVKRKPVVVLSPEQKPTGHDLDLIELAGCPHAHDADELAAVLRPDDAGSGVPCGARDRRRTVRQAILRGLRKRVGGHHRGCRSRGGRSDSVTRATTDRLREARVDVGRTLNARRRDRAPRLVEAEDVVPDDLCLGPQAEHEGLEIENSRAGALRQVGTPANWRCPAAPGSPDWRGAVPKRGGRSGGGLVRTMTWRRLTPSPPAASTSASGDLGRSRVGSGIPQTACRTAHRSIRSPASSNWHTRREAGPQSHGTP